MKYNAIGLAHFVRNEPKIYLFNMPLLVDQSYTYSIIPYSIIGRFSKIRKASFFMKRAILLVRNVPDSNEMWSHNFGKGQAVLDF